MGGELFHAGGGTDRKTDMTKLIVAFRNFTNATKNVIYNSLQVYNMHYTYIIVTAFIDYTDG